MHALGALALALVASSATRYEGGIFGVNAGVTLKGNVATVALRGIPIGGLVQGRAVLADDGELLLEGALRRALERNMCAVESVQAVGDEVEINVTFPFGRRSVRLRPV